jgi:hypothetical protein
MRHVLQLHQTAAATCTPPSRAPPRRSAAPSRLRAVAPTASAPSPAVSTAYAWLSPDIDALSKRSALAGASDVAIGSRAREEALSAALQNIVQASRSPHVRAVADAARSQTCPALRVLDVSGWAMTRDGPLLKTADPGLNLQRRRLRRPR